MKFRNKAEMCTVTKSRTAMKLRAAAVFAMLSILVSLLIAALSGCGANGGQSAQSGASEISAIEPVEQAGVKTVGTLHMLPLTEGGAVGDNTGDAYYEYLLQGGNQDFAAVIAKTDYATGRQTCICQKSGCKHKDESCNSYISDVRYISLWVENDAVYLYYNSRITENTSIQGVFEPQSYIDCISLDASEKHRIVEFPLGINPTVLYSDGTYLFGNYKN